MACTFMAGKHKALASAVCGGVLAIALTGAQFSGTGEPPGSEFLLYQAPGALTNSGPTVLLVMGANDSVDREYADPRWAGPGPAARFPARPPG